MNQKKVLVISDISCVGKCALTVALPILSASGCAVSVLPTALLSAHTAFEGAVIKKTGDEMKSFLSHWKSLNMDFDAILTGYLSEPEQVDIILEVFDMYPNAVKIVDPVMADNGKLYRGFDESFPAQMKRLCVRADIIVPNMTEAALLTETDRKDGAATLDELGEKLLAMGAKKVVVTGVCIGSSIGAAVFGERGKRIVLSSLKRETFHGTGDIFASVLTSRILMGITVEDAAQFACDFVSQSIALTGDVPDTRYGVAFEPLLNKLT